MNSRAAAKSFRDLLVWQKAHQFVLTVYSYSAGFPRVETYGLTSQLRRAAVSIPANISEGFRRRGKPDKARFLNIAQGSLEECRYYLILSQDLNYGSTEELMNQIEQVSRMLQMYVRTVISDA
ncbi:MAG TPA: four helix bundle protein [Bryobacteraceae bacterium]|nr:four helix bundle protein [Bryobacteraceae bacterium]